MKKAALVLAVLAVFFACKRTVHDSGCISLYNGPVYTSQLGPGQLDTIKTLFSANGLSITSNLQFVSYNSDTSVNSSGVSSFYQNVSAALFVNGLPVFNTEASWNFKNGTLDNSDIPSYPYPGSDTTTHYTLPELRSQFFKTFEAALYSTAANYQDQHMARPGIYYHDSCFFAQLGYAAPVSQTGNTVTFANYLVKVWRVTPSSLITTFPIPLPPAELNPTVYVVDSTGYSWIEYPHYPGQHFPDCPSCLTF